MCKHPSGSHPAQLFAVRIEGDVGTESTFRHNTRATTLGHGATIVLRYRIGGPGAKSPGQSGTLLCFATAVCLHTGRQPKAFYWTAFYLPNHPNPKRRPATCWDPKVPCAKHTRTFGPRGCARQWRRRMLSAFKRMLRTSLAPVLGAEHSSVCLAEFDAAL